MAGIGLFLGAVTTAPLVALIGRNRYVVILLAIVGVLVPVTGRGVQPVDDHGGSDPSWPSPINRPKICADTVVQTDSDDAHIGRVFALYDTSNNIFYVAGFALCVPLLPADGHSLPPIIAIGAILILTALFLLVGNALADPRTPLFRLNNRGHQLFRLNNRGRRITGRHASGRCAGDRARTRC